MWTHNLFRMLRSVAALPFLPRGNYPSPSRALPFKGHCSFLGHIIGNTGKYIQKYQRGTPRDASTSRYGDWRRSSRLVTRIASTEIWPPCFNTCLQHAVNHISPVKDNQTSQFYETTHVVFRLINSEFHRTFSRLLVRIIFLILLS